MKFIKRIREAESFLDAVIGYKYVMVDYISDEWLKYPYLVISLYIPYLFNIRFYRDRWNKKYFRFFTYKTLKKNQQDVQSYLID